MISTKDFNQKSTPSTRISRGGVVCESPAQSLQDIPIRGTKDPNMELERFFNRFPDLLWDDLEDEFNELIGILRNRVLDYWDIV